MHIRLGRNHTPLRLLVATGGMSSRVQRGRIVRPSARDGGSGRGSTGPGRRSGGAPMSTAVVVAAAPANGSQRGRGRGTTTRGGGRGRGTPALHVDSRLAPKAAATVSQASNQFPTNGDLWYYAYSDSETFEQPVVELRFVLDCKESDILASFQTLAYIRSSKISGLSCKRLLVSWLYPKSVVLRIVQGWITMVTITILPVTRISM